MANNLGKASVVACVALAGYNVNKKEDEKVEEETPSPAEETNNKPALKPKPSSVAPVQVAAGQSYASNASNVIQNNQNLIATANSLSTNSSSTDSDSSPNNNDIELTNQVMRMFSKYVVSGTAQNIVVKSILDILLTPFIANKLATEPEQEVLKILTQNTRNPYLIWDNSTRAQLLDFLEFQRLNSSKEQYTDITDIYNTTSKFVYDATRDELKVGGVYIRIYNEMPTFPISNPKLFVIDLLEYLKQAYTFITASGTPRKIQNSMQKPLIPVPASKATESILNEYNKSKIKNQLEKSVPTDLTGTTKKTDYDFASDKKFIEHLIMTMNSLISVIKLNPNVELQCIGNFDILFGFLSISACEQNQAIKLLALEIISLISRNKDCVTEIAACEILGQFLKVIKDDDFASMRQKVLDTLSGLINAPKLVKEAHTKGIVIYLLDQYCNSNVPQIRETSAEILAKMTSDKLSGPKVRITVCKFLPAVFLDAMIDSPQTSVQIFESEHEHPELIWNEKIRDRVSMTIRKMTDNFYQAQKQNSDLVWKDPEILPEITTSELVVSGVYLRLYASNPGWTLRKPKQFLSDLLDFIVENTSRSGVTKEVLDISTSALVGLLNNSPHLADSVPVLGHIPKLFRQLSVQPKSTLSVIHQLSLSDVSIKFSRTWFFIKRSAERFNPLKLILILSYSNLISEKLI